MLLLVVVAGLALALWGARGGAVLERGAAAAARRGASGGGPAATPKPLGALKSHSAGANSPEAISVRWGGSARCYPKAMVAEGLQFIRAQLRDTRNFGWPGAGEWRRLGAEAARLSRKYGVELAAPRLVSMRNTEVALAARSGGARALRREPAIVAASRRGAPILEIAARHRLPPMAVLKQVLLAAGHSPAEVRAMVADPARLPPALAREAPAIFEADLGSRPNAERIRARAQAFEDAVGAHLRALGLEFRTEADLRREHASRLQREGEPTPDFLLTRPALIDGRRVNWVDAKDYASVDSRLVAGGLARQGGKYMAKFGPGALVFGGGVMCDSRLAGPSLLLLDGTHIKPGAEPSGARPGKNADKAYPAECRFTAVA